MSDNSHTGYSLKRAPRLQEVNRLRRAAWAFTTRRVPGGVACTILQEACGPKPGDVLIARIDELGHHRGLQLSTGRRIHLFEGDEIVVAYGNRYAPNQFEAVVPTTLGPCHLVAAGGVAAKALSWHEKIGRGPTRITPIGLLGDAAGVPVNLRDHALVPPMEETFEPGPTTIAVVGTAMDSGKTQTAAFLVKGLTRAGLHVGFAKITGTGAGGDFWLLRDAGADPVLDFTDAGYVSTYLVALAEIERILVTLTSHLSKSGVDTIVLEIADGVLQPETAALLNSPVFRSIVGGVLFAARDSMGAVAGARWLSEHDHAVLGLSGVLTASPLQCREAMLATGMPVFSRAELAQASNAMMILGHARTNAAKGSESTIEFNGASIRSSDQGYRT